MRRLKASHKRARRFTPAATRCRCERSTYLYRGIYCREHHDDPRNREAIAAMSLE